MSKLILFDVDKTLVDSSSLKDQKVFPEALRNVYGVEVSLDMISTHGMTDQQIILELAVAAGISEEDAENKLEQCMGRMEQLYEENYEMEDVELLEGVKEALNLLSKSDIKMGLVTGNLESIARGKLADAGINDFFTVGGFGDESSKRSELVEIAVDEAREYFNIEAFDQVFLVGDSPKDIRAGNRVGVKTVGTTTGVYSPRELEKAGADEIIEGWGDERELRRVFLSNS